MSVSLEFLKNIPPNHKFIQFSEKPLTGVVTEVSVILANQYLKRNMSSIKWRKEKLTWRVNYESPSGQKQTSKPVNYLTFSNYLRSHADFEPKDFNLPDLTCVWLDHSTEMKLNFHMHDDTETLGFSSGDLQAHYYGDQYPIRPILRREGRLFTSFQPQLLRRIINKRSELIKSSNKSLSDEWILDFRNLVSDTVSLLDIALIQLYIKAEYSPLESWTFDKTKLGERHGRKLNDKLKWVSMISGREFNIEKEKSSLNSLRMLRNHLMHFDPPSLVITVEEITIWLNQIIDIGRILIKLRQTINVNVSLEMINFMLQKEAIFNPYDKGARLPLNSNMNDDYNSSVWPR